MVAREMDDKHAAKSELVRYSRELVTDYPRLND